MRVMDIDSGSNGESGSEDSMSDDMRTFCGDSAYNSVLNPYCSSGQRTARTAQNLDVSNDFSSLLMKKGSTIIPAWIKSYKESE